MTVPGSPDAATGIEGREASAPGAVSEARAPLAPFLDELAESLRARRHDLLDRVHDLLWERIRRTADRLGALRDEAIGGEDELRDAGRAVRMACDDLEELEPWEVLGEELTRHLEDVAGLAHVIPRTLETAGQPGAAGRIPARSAARVALADEYAAAVAEGLDAEVLVGRPARAVPRSPADLLRPADHGEALLEAADRAERHLRVVLEEAAAGAVGSADRLARDRGPAGRLRLRWRLGRAEGRRRNAAAAVERKLAEAAEEARHHLDDRRFAADLARRKRVLNEAAAEAADRLEEAAARSGDLRQLADRLEAAGRRAARTAPDRPSGGEPSAASRLADIHGRVKEVTAALRSSLPAMDRPEAPFPRALDRTVRLSHALFDLSGPGGADRRVPEHGEGPGPEAAAELRSRVSRAVTEVREQIWEAEQILGQGVRAGRAAEASDTAEPGEMEQLVRTTGERTARRLRAAADELDGQVGRGADEVRGLPDELIAEIKRRVHAARGEAVPAGRVREGLEVVREAAERVVRAAGSALAPIADAVRRGVSRLRPGGTEAVGRRLAKAGAEADFARDVAAAGLRRDGEGMEGLPLLYRWLFRPEPLDDPHLLVGRGQEIDRLRETAARWRRNRDAAVAVVGEPGSGKTTLLNCWTHEVGGAASLRRGRVDRRLSEAGAAARWFADFLAVDGPGDVRDAADVARALGDRREIVLLENGERLFRREVGGFGAVETLAELIERTAGRLAWVVSFELEAWLYLQTVSAVEGPFFDVVRIAPLERAQLEEAVLSRHRLTGFELRFMAGEDLSRRRKARLDGASEEDRQALLREWYFDDLHRAGGRTVGRALQLWRASVHGGVEGEARVHPVRVPDVDFLSELDRETLFLLAAFVVHGDLDRPDVGRLPSTDVDRVRERLARLARLGVLRPVEGLPPPAPLRVDRWLHAPVTDLLRSERLLHL